MSDPSAPFSGGQAPGAPSAGWYPDPAGPGSRYWDGARWTEHTQPLPGTPGPPHPPAAMQHTPMPAAPVARSSPSTSFLDQLKQGEGTALVVLCGALLVLATFLPWAKLSISDGQGSELADKKNAWAGDVPWLIRGFGAEEYRVAVATQTGDAPSGGTDLIVILPLVIAAGAVVVAGQQGKRISRAREIVVGCTGLLTLILVLEIVHLNSWAGDLQDAITRAGGTAAVDGGAAYGLWIATAAAAGMTFGAVRSFIAERALDGAPSSGV